MGSDICSLIHCPYVVLLKALKLLFVGPKVAWMRKRASCAGERSHCSDSGGKDVVVVTVLLVVVVAVLLVVAVKVLLVVVVVVTVLLLSPLLSPLLSLLPSLLVLLLTSLISYVVMVVIVAVVVIAVLPILVLLVLLPLSLVLLALLLLLLPLLSVTWGVDKLITEMLPEVTSLIPVRVLRAVTRFVAIVSWLMLVVKAAVTAADELAGTVMV